MRVSVIIPAFNAAETISSCLDSAVDVSVETIVVDDGSTDGTADMVRKSFPGASVLRQSNRGVSAARNAGLDTATGDYVAFVDADDRLFPDALRAARAAAEEAEPDILILRSFGADREHYPWERRFKPGRDYSLEDIKKEGYMRGSVCGCLFKRDYLLRTALRFPEGIAMAEDQLFLNAAIAYGGRIRFKDIPFYQVDERPGSASRCYDDSFFTRLSAALTRAPEMIPDTGMCARVRLSIIQEMTRVAIGTGRSPSEVRRLTCLDKALPIPVSSMKGERLAACLLNIGYPLFYRMKELKMRFE